MQDAAASKMLLPEFRQPYLEKKGETKKKQEKQKTKRKGSSKKTFPQKSFTLSIGGSVHQSGL